MKFHRADKYEKAFRNNRTRGIAIILPKICEMKIEEKRKNEMGRYIITKGRMKGQEIALVNIYAPNEKQGFFFKKKCKK